MQANFVGKLMADNIDKDALIGILSETVLRLQTEIDALKEQVVAWEKSAMDCRIKLELSQCTRYFDKAQEK